MYMDYILQALVVNEKSQRDWGGYRDLEANGTDITGLEGFGFMYLQCSV